jgi:quercetin dioxygenase-like cupin family protein
MGRCRQAAVHGREQPAMPMAVRVDLHLADDADRTCVWETDHVQVMRVRMAVGEALPHHNSNSNVLLLPLSGTLQLVVPDAEETFGAGQAMSVPCDTPMDIRNAGDDAVVLLIVKTPHPEALG